MERLRVRFKSGKKERSKMVVVKYSKSLEKLEEIINQIENEEIDVDELSEKVKEAVGLINVCKEKIEKAEVEVKKVVQTFNSAQE